MKTLAINMIIKALMPVIHRLLRENYGLYGDKLFDFFENAIKDSKTTIDDKVVLPIIKSLRVLMNIPDLPDE